LRRRTLPVADERRWHHDQREQRERHRNQDRHVGVEDGQAAVAWLDLLERRNGSEDHQQQHREPDTPDRPDPVPEEQRELDAGKAREGGRPRGDRRRVVDDCHLDLLPV